MVNLGKLDRIQREELVKLIEENGMELDTFGFRDNSLSGFVKSKRSDEECSMIVGYVGNTVLLINKEGENSSKYHSKFKELYETVTK